MPLSVLLVSSYELGRQPFALASASAQLERAGHSVRAADASLGPIKETDFDGADLVAISAPMHTALRLAIEIAARARRVNPAAHLCAFGLYAWMDAAHLLAEVCDSVIGGEFEASLVDLANRLETAADLEGVDGLTTRATLKSKDGRIEPPVLKRLEFIRPKRDELPPLDRYARLLGPAPGEQRLAGTVEASRGCKHRCRHCPVVPVYDGRFFIVPEDVVIDDAAQQIAAGARHLTFGDPDFLNGPKHTLRIARRLHAEYPEISFDITTKVEHVLAQSGIFTELRELGCVFVVSALESLSDRVLVELDKGHTRADIFEALDVLRSAGLPLRPSFVPFTPWSRLDDYLDLVDFVFEHDLVANTDPIQLTIRLLVPSGSALLWPSIKRPAADAVHRPAFIEPYDKHELGHRWTHADPRMDALQREVSGVVERGARDKLDDRSVLEQIRTAAYRAAERRPAALPKAERTAFVPRMSEPWFCCAEPSRELVERIRADTADDASCCGSSRAKS